MQEEEKGRRETERRPRGCPRTHLPSPRHKKLSLSLPPSPFHRHLSFFLPFFSVQDGYAVRSSDPPGTYPVAFAVAAGADPAARALPAGSVAYITTGAPLPAGADAVVQVEDTEAVEGGGGGGGAATVVRILKVRGRGGERGWRGVLSGERERRASAFFLLFHSQPPFPALSQAAPAPGADVRAVGSDIAAGSVILRAGDLVGPAEVGLAATAGVGVLSLVARPAVAVLSTGDELTDAGGWAAPGGAAAAAAPPMPVPPLAPGKVYDANRPLLLASASAAGATVADLGIAPDAGPAVEAALDAALASPAHILITTGGVSMGSADAVKPALAARGRVLFGKCRMKPGKPLTFAILDRPAGRPGPLLVFGLPGNPASAAVTFALVVGPAIRALAGWAQPRPRRVHARLEGPVRLDPERPEYHRAVLTWRNAPVGALDAAGAPPPGDAGPDPTGLAAPGWFGAASTGGQISSRLGSVRGATALLELPAVAGVLAAGSVVSALVVGEVGGMPVGEEAVAATPGI